MRKSVLIFLLSQIFVLAFLVHSVWTLITLLFVSGVEDQISRAELPAPNSNAISTRPQLIPKIIHQTYINESIPAHWKDPQQTCIDLHPDYEYKVGGTIRDREVGIC
jgi:mannosyltransferase OCH1-like enzyme